MEHNPSQMIKELVESSPFTYAELEKKTGISKSALQRYSSGNTKKIPIEAIEKIASALGISAAFILGWDNNKSAAKLDDELIKKMMSLDIESLKKINDYVDLLLLKQENQDNK